MKKRSTSFIQISVFILLSLFIHAASNAQCPICPPQMIVHDSLNCNSKTLIKDTSQNVAVPNYTNEITDLFLACKNSTMKYIITPEPFVFQGNLCTYNALTFDTIIVTGGVLVSNVSNNLTVQWGSNNVGSILIAFTITPANVGAVSCNDTILLRFSLINNPVAAFTATPQPVCFNSPVNITFNSNATTGASTYYWNFGDGYTHLGPNPSHNYTSAGTYNVCLYVSNATPPNGLPIFIPGACLNCSDTLCQTITIDALPGPDIECVSTVCSGDTSNYCTSAAGCSAYNWTVTGGAIISGQNTPCITVIWGSGNPQGSIHLSTSACNIPYCNSGTTVSVPVIPSTSAIAGDTIVCINANEIYALPAWPSATYTWSVNAPALINGNNTNTNIINVNWNTIGNYTITASWFDTILNCGGSASRTVFVKPVLVINGNKTVCINATNNYGSFFTPPNTPVPSNWSISPAGAAINAGNGTPLVNISWNTAGTFTLTANPVNPTSVCGPATYEVVVLPAPVISAINGNDSICPNSTLVYSATSNSNGVFTWNVVGGTFISLSANNDSIQIVWNNIGPYSVTVNQTSLPNNCVSNTLVKNSFPYPVPLISGTTTVCADATITYVITNITNGSFNWSITPANLGTVLSGQGNDTVQIKWHGNNNPGFSTIAYLHYGACGNDSIVITINEPAPLSINASGTLCSGGVNLTTGATGTFLWTCTEHPISPVQNVTLSSLTALNLPGHYNVTIQNYNNTGCTVNATYNILSTGLPSAQITASGVLQYCVSSLPNMTLSALVVAGYTFQWYKNNTPVGTGSTLAVNSGAPCFVNAVGTYDFYCDVTYLGCVVSSNHIIVTVLNCIGSPGGGTGNNPGCGASIAITNVSPCNPFTVTVNATAPLGATIVPGSQTITHLDDNSTVPGLTTKTYTTNGYKIFTVCATVLLPNLTTCIVCKDTTALVDIAAKFLVNDSCGTVYTTNQTAVFAPATIVGYNWYVGDYPNNFAVLPIQASINNPAMANPVITFFQSDTFIINQIAISSSGCVSQFKDTIVIILPDAGFVTTNTCQFKVETFTAINNFPVNYWDFGDASSSYTNPTSHAYANTGLYLITHVVKDNFGCVDTFTAPIFVNPNQSCTITFAGPTTFCNGDSLVLIGCPGHINYQWYQNGTIIPLAINQNYTAKQTGNYHFTATDINGCTVTSDTVSISVLPSPSTTFYKNGSNCASMPFEIGVPACSPCFYIWSVDNVIQPGNLYKLTGMSGAPPFTLGTHIIKVVVIGSNGCMATDSSTQTFYANPTLNTTISGNPPQMCSNNIYTITATSNAVSPTWLWTYNNINISNTFTATVSAAGAYKVVVTDGLSGCTSSSVNTVDPSPDLTLFPLGCDSLCKTDHLYLPLSSLNGNISGYTITWYDNAPPYNTIVGTGAILNLNSLSVGNHNLSVIVMGPNGCIDTSNVYDIDVYNCFFPLAIKNLKFNVYKLFNTGLIQFETKEEKNVDYFDIEKSADGSAFYKFNTLFSKGENQKNTYADEDHQLLQGNNFYRLKIVDEDGTFYYSEIRNIVFGLSVSSILIYPVISPDGIYHIQSADPIEKIQVRSITGKILKTIESSVNIEQFSLEEFANGLYLITLSTNGETITQKVIKQ